MKGAPRSTPNDTRRALYRFDKGTGGDQVRACIVTFNGQTYVDLRLYFRSRDGDHRPTQKGLMLSHELLCDLERALATLRAEVERMRAAGTLAVRRPGRLERYLRERAIGRPRDGHPNDEQR